MDRQTIEIDGRSYEALIEGENTIILGPPEELIATLGLPEPLATNLHNILHRRRLLNYQEVCKRPKELIGALQEALGLDAQKLQEAFFKIEQEVSNE